MGIRAGCAAPGRRGYGVLLYCNTFMPGEVRIITEKRRLRRAAAKLFQRPSA